MGPRRQRSQGQPFWGREDRLGVPLSPWGPQILGSSIHSLQGSQTCAAGVGGSHGPRQDTLGVLACGQALGEKFIFVCMDPLGPQSQ